MRTIGASPELSCSFPAPSIALTASPSPSTTGEVDHKLDFWCLAGLVPNSVRMRGEIGSADGNEKAARNRRVRQDSANSDGTKARILKRSSKCQASRKLGEVEVAGTNVEDDHGSGISRRRPTWFLSRQSFFNSSEHSVDTRTTEGFKSSLCGEYCGLCSLLCFKLRVYVFPKEQANSPRFIVNTSSTLKWLFARLAVRAS